MSRENADRRPRSSTKSFTAIPDFHVGSAIRAGYRHGMAETDWAPTIGTRLRALLRSTPHGAPRRFSERWESFARWPPNVFAFTSLLLEESGAYRFAVSPPEGHHWPPSAKWNARVKKAAKAWRDTAARKAVPPSLVMKLGRSLRAHRSTTIDALSSGRAWKAIIALLELHAIADEACAGVGIPSQKFDPFVLDASMMLAEKDTLADVAPNTMIVLPKLRTPQAGISIRSLSQHLAAHRSEVKVRWRLADGLCPSREERLNLLVLPWPYRIEPQAFKVAPSRLDNMDPNRFGFFDFAPDAALDCERLGKLIEEGKRRCGAVHGVVLPEGAISEEEIASLEKCLAANGVSMLVAGVRGPSKNFAHLSVRTEHEPQQSWTQHKHHRWCIDGSQIHQYHLGTALHPSKRWWENIEIRERELHFVAANGWLTMCHLICEDLARQEPVASVVRAVGPNLVIALLLDGPQLTERWPGRYASVLADDPGSSVLSVTSLGMSLRSWSTQHAPSRVVALWKDPQRGAVSIALERDHDALLLCLTAKWTREWLADGRDDDEAAAQLVLSGVEQIREPPAARS